MADEDKQGNNTNLLLGKVIGRLDATVQNLNEQNAALKGVNKRLDVLPCGIMEERVTGLMNWREELDAAATRRNKIKHFNKNELKVAILSSLITGAFTIIGVWFILLRAS
ncbi:hypothetical protein LCGC14_2615460 [marine sediment metagenome]|uniref:Uncharacterized protein n=1 Tax=marine sediment metagenome TaxID=412755 RepID=A0A0F9AS79_9ZZZZ